jgi:hypothetical protein
MAALLKLNHKSTGPIIFTSPLVLPAAASETLKLGPFFGLAEHLVSHCTGIKAQRPNLRIVGRDRFAELARMD